MAPGSMDLVVDYQFRFQFHPSWETSILPWLPHAKPRWGKGREVVDTWSTEYYSFGKKTCGNNYNHEQELTITILLGKINVNGPRTMLRLPQRKNPIPQGGGVLIKSSSFLYGRDTDDQNGLIVILRARRRDDDKELPIMITVKHYFCCRVLLSWCLCCGKDS
ncbi:hypothetical protein JHK82_023935 [Glycine max]|nr:hypothetical protein JHK85_024499 [Glycine max]KAG5011745.1 hypothetical protein JHK86_024006 [Glycine max]KAG5132747.1 hypothetical protein JHK82_023935 [Glycine max]